MAGAAIGGLLMVATPVAPAPALPQPWPELVLSAPSRSAAVTTSGVVLAPMAGVTNAAYRQLCREQAESALPEPPKDGDPTPALFVCEMITSRGLVERDEKSLSMLAFDPGERTRSVQLYGVDPAVMAKATRMLCEEFGVNHVDLNFGCPVPKVTRKGGGGVLPWKRDLLEAILTSVVGAADEFGVPVTMKTRMGIDGAHLTYRDAGRIAEQSGCAAIALHGRTVAQSYSGVADWDAIADLVQHVDLPVLGNGDVWEADDARRMLDHTGAAGVVVGRGCLGRPWLFHDLVAASLGRDQVALPTLGEVAAILRRHAVLLAGIMGEQRGLTDLRKHMAWYFKGFPVGALRRRFAMVASLAELDDLLAELDPAAEFPETELGQPRGRQGSPRGKVVMPQGWLDSECGLDLDLADAELDSSGG
ncbi:tRNA dihydrouridine synthase DusB [Parenemella sanctibonifatiensis]|nr:tRNA dihydrouridine synthase DusB [Parenemella sanctibonifatiensis]